MKNLRRLLVILSAMVLCAAPVRAQQLLYAATGANGTAGSLYLINPNTAAATLVAPITNSAGGGAIGLTGLAFDPVNSFLYGVTSNSTMSAVQGVPPNTVSSSLVRINPATGVATVIGSLGFAISDISFHSNETLYGFQGTSGNPGTARSMMTIDLGTGAASKVGATDLTATNGGGLAFNLANTLYLSATGADGTLDTLDLAGARTVGPTLTGAPFPSALVAMSFDSAGTLFAIDSDRTNIFPGSSSYLVTIDFSTGAVTQVGADELPPNIDALAFIIPEPSALALASIGLGAIAAALARRSKRG